MAEPKSDNLVFEVRFVKVQAMARQGAESGPQELGLNGMKTRVEVTPTGRVVRVDVASAKPSFVEVVAEQAETLRQVERVGGKFLANYLKDAHAEVRLLSSAGALEQVLPLPGLGTVWLTEGDDSRSETFRLNRKDVDGKFVIVRAVDAQYNVATASAK